MSKKTPARATNPATGAADVSDTAAQLAEATERHHAALRAKQAADDEANAADDALFARASKDPLLVAAAGVTNGMGVDVIRSRILTTARAQGLTA